MPHLQISGNRKHRCLLKCIIFHVRRSYVYDFKHVVFVVFFFFLLPCIESLAFQAVKFKKADLENTVTFIFEC